MFSAAGGGNCPFFLGLFDLDWAMIVCCFLLSLEGVCLCWMEGWVVRWCFF